MGIHDTYTMCLNFNPLPPSHLRVARTFARASTSRSEPEVVRSEDLMRDDGDGLVKGELRVSRAARKWQEATRDQTRRASTQHIEQPDICQISGPVWYTLRGQTSEMMAGGSKRQAAIERDARAHLALPPPPCPPSAPAKPRSRTAAAAPSAHPRPVNSPSPPKTRADRGSTTASRNGSARATPTSPRPPFSSAYPQSPPCPPPSASELDSDSELV